MSSKKKHKNLNKVYQIKISLRDIRPPIWRRIEVLSDTTLERLHVIFQFAMGWNNYHIHQFTIGKVVYGQPHPDFDYEVKDERKVKLSQMAFKEKTKFVYEYDFGNWWEHLVLFEKILPVEKGKHYPYCSKGKRACPPEDVGGPSGYADFLEIVRDATHSEHDDMLEWVGGEFDAEKLNLELVNENLKQIR